MTQGHPFQGCRNGLPLRVTILYNNGRDGATYTHNKSRLPAFAEQPTLRRQKPARAGPLTSYHFAPSSLSPSSGAGASGASPAGASGASGASGMSLLPSSPAGACGAGAWFWSSPVPVVGAWGKPFSSCSSVGFCESGFIDPPFLNACALHYRERGAITQQFRRQARGRHRKERSTGQPSGRALRPLGE